MDAGKRMVVKRMWVLHRTQLAALQFGHRAGLPRIIGVARESNGASRSVMSDIGMRECGEFLNRGHRMVMFESLARG